jgi:hypothetical protein
MIANDDAFLPLTVGADVSRELISRITCTPTRLHACASQRRALTIAAAHRYKRFYTMTITARVVGAD